MSTLQIAFTALATVIGGALTLVVGQIIVRGALEPALELKGLIGTIASDMDFMPISLRLRKKNGVIYSENTHAHSGRN